MFGDLETIAAIGTPKGLGALGIVRVSGPNTIDILKSSFKSKKLSFDESHKAFFGIWSCPETGEALDEVVVVFFAKGRGYTGEDAADIICHGGPQVMELILNATLKAGARLAKPGEFTYRAVMQGRLNLAQAENVLQLIHAKSPRAASIALQQLRGSLSRKLEKIEADLIFLLANLEASIDFTTEDIQPVDYQEMWSRVNQIIVEAEGLLKGYVASQVVNQGIRVAFVGRPNSGKSSLMNSLLRRKRSIVSVNPGTTRDLVEAEILVEGSLFILIDTAGLRKTEDEVESQGVELTLEEFQRADYLLYIVDSTAGLNNEDVEKILSVEPERVLICFNKTDVVNLDFSIQIQKFGLQEYKWTSSSAVVEGGEAQVREFFKTGLLKLTTCDLNFDISTQRQKESLTKATANLIQAADSLAKKRSPDLISLELREALEQVNGILGKNVSDEVMEKVFKEFCIGK